MNNNLTLTISADKDINSCFNQIINFRGWWSEEIEGSTDQLNETFYYHHKDVHMCRIRLIELNAPTQIKYKVVDNQFSFTKDKKEWTGTYLKFDLKNEEGRTNITFTHEGLTPEDECYNICSESWTFYIQTSLKEYLETGKGRPNPKEAEGFNNEIVRKWKLSGVE